MCFRSLLAQPPSARRVLAGAPEMAAAAPPGDRPAGADGRVLTALPRTPAPTAAQLSRTQRRRAQRQRYVRALREKLGGQTGPRDEVQRRLAMAAPCVRAGIAGVDATSLHRRRRNAALHVFDVEAGVIEAAGSSELNRLQRSGVRPRTYPAGAPSPHRGAPDSVPAASEGAWDAVLHPAVTALHENATAILEWALCTHSLATRRSSAIARVLTAASQRDADAILRGALVVWQAASSSSRSARLLPLHRLIAAACRRDALATALGALAMWKVATLACRHAERRTGRDRGSAGGTHAAGTATSGAPASDASALGPTRDVADSACSCGRLRVSSRRRVASLWWRRGQRCHCGWALAGRLLPGRLCVRGAGRLRPRCRKRDCRPCLLVRHGS